MFDDSESEPERERPKGPTREELGEMLAEWLKENKIRKFGPGEFDVEPKQKIETKNRQQRAAEVERKKAG